MNKEKLDKIKTFIKHLYQENDVIALREYGELMEKEISNLIEILITIGYEIRKQEEKK